MTGYMVDSNYEMQERDCDFIMSVCDECGKHTPPNECELCLSDAYKKCPKIVEAIKKYDEENR
jgi:hypothetical protein